MHCQMYKGVTAARHRSMPAQTGLQRGMYRPHRIVASNVPSIAKKCAAWRTCMPPAGVCSKNNPTAPASLLTFKGVSTSTRARPFAAALDKVRWYLSMHVQTLASATPLSVFHEETAVT